MPDSLVARIMKAKYHPDCSVIDAPLAKKPSFAWRSIQSSCTLIREGLIWRIGKMARTWEDRWLPNPSTYRVQSLPKVPEPTATVSCLFDESGHSWNHNLLDMVFSAEESGLIKSIPISTSNQEDRLIWRGTERGTFSVKSAYHIQKEWDLQ